MKRETIKRVGFFISITFGLSWIIISLFLVFGGAWGTLSSGIVATIYMCMPALSVVLVQKG